MVKFSVLMSVYAKEHPVYFVKSVDSILNQTVKPSEIIIVKDGPLTSELDKIINDFVHKYPNMFNIIGLKKNNGLGIALKLGVEHSKYDIIARMDTDDIANKERFEKQLNVLVSNPEIDIVGSYIDEFDGEITNVLSIRKVPTTNEKIYMYAKKRNPFNHMTVMFRKEAVLNAGNYEHFLYNEDYYLWARMILNNSKMINIPESLVYARTGRDLFKRRGGLKYILSEISLQKKFYNIGFTNFRETLMNIIIRTIIRIIPNDLRGYIYTKFLRK